jgi:hypothetical protein
MARFGEDATGILDDRFGVDGSGDWATSINFRHDLMNGSFLVVFVVINQPVFCHGCIGEVIDFATFATHPTERITCFTRIVGCTGRIDLVTKSLRTFCGTSQVWIAA